MPGDTMKPWARCGFCGSARPDAALKDGECVDRQWCATTASAEKAPACIHDAAWMKALAEAERAALDQARAAEREACALLAEDRYHFDLAKEIRARGSR